MIDEREHRRGLVLGLTLAEVMLLVLFLLLLALGSRLSKLDEARKSAEVERDELKSEMVVLRSPKLSLPLPPITTGTIPDKDIISEQAPSPEHTSLKTILADPTKYSALNAVVDAAAELNPDDPPAELKIALDLIKRWAPDAGMQETMNDAHQRASKIDPEKPAIAVIKAIEVFEQQEAKGHSPIASPPPPEGKHDWPPIITLNEAEGYFFQSGSAELSPKFRATLSGDIIGRLLDVTEKYDVNVIEVIGHTDEEPLILRPSNLDKTLLPFMHKSVEVGGLIPADNAGLGLARAASVVRVLSDDVRLSKFRILPMSGAQLIDVGDTLAAGVAPGDVEQRRRIEIRVRRSDREQSPVVVRLVQPVDSAKKPFPAPKASKDQATKTAPQSKPGDWLTSIFGQ